MHGCETYTSMCRDGSRVQQCQTEILAIPPDTTLKQYIANMCNSMPMPACSQCGIVNCKSLSVYSALCLSMPGMSQCQDWKNMCMKIPDWSMICPPNIQDYVVPEMRMYFHTGFVDYILFKEWMPYDALTYAFSFIGVFLMALLHEAFHIIPVFFDSKWRPKEESEFLNSSPGTNYQTANNNSNGQKRYQAFSWKRDAFRALYRGVDVAAHFLIMLVTMTFNVGLFVAVVLGYAVGHFLFGRFTRKPQMPKMNLNNEGEKYECH